MSNSSRIRSIPRGRIVVERPGAEDWICNCPPELFATHHTWWTSFLAERPHKLMVWFACDCAERQHGQTRDRGEMELVITTAARRWVAGMVEAEACDFAVDETVQTTFASWRAAQAVMLPPSQAWILVRDASASVLASLRADGGLEHHEEDWQRLRLAILCQMPAEIWTDPTVFQAACDMAEEQVRPWSETFLELMGVPEGAWAPTWLESDS